jgi:hypothetical protein
MCLQIKLNQEPSIAEEDIFCYKVLESHTKRERIRTFYRGAIVEIGKTYHSILKKGNLCNFNFKYDIIEDGLHSYANIEDAQDNAKMWNDKSLQTIGSRNIL